MIPTPLPGESENDFIVRAHAALKDLYPVTDERNQIVYEAWRKGKDLLHEAALEKFKDGYECLRDVPVFAEHETVNHDGTEGKYGLDELREIVDECNYRIEDTSDYAALSEGHTPTKEEITQGAKMPEVLGYAGPFRLGMIGNKEPRWAIFGDEWHDIRHKDKLRGLKRRSPEVWLEGKKFFDPIAALGSETPRLSLGMRFSRNAQGRLVERYSAGSVSPGATSVFVPDDNTKERYEESESVDENAIKQFLDALMQTEVFQWVQAKMAEEQQWAGDDYEMEESPEDLPMDDGMDDGMGDGMDVPPEMDMPEEEPEAYEMDEEEEDDDMPALAKYSRQRREKERYQKMQADNKALSARLKKLEDEKRKTERYSRLSELGNSRAIDVDAEYKRAAKFDDETFDAFFSAIEDNAERIPVGQSFFVPPAEAIKTEKYSKDTAQKARDLALQSGIPYEQALEQVRSK